MKKDLKKLADQGFLLSVGLASIGKEKAEKLIEQLVKKGRLNEKQGRALANKLIKKSKAEKKKLESRFRRVTVTKKKKVSRKKKRK